MSWHVLSVPDWSGNAPFRSKVFIETSAQHPHSHSTVTHISTTAEDNLLDTGCRWLQARSGNGPEAFISNPAWCVFAVQCLSEELSFASQAHTSELQNSQGRPLVRVLIRIQEIEEKTRAPIVGIPNCSKAAIAKT